MLAVSLFSGAGGFEIGFDRAGIRTVLQAERDPWCLEVLAHHWPEVDRVDDVRKVDARALSGRGGCVAGAGDCPDAQRLRPQRGDEIDSPVDLVYGGFPCQDLSVAGKRAGLRGDRSGLFYEFVRVVRDLRPRWFALENVPGLLSSADGADFGAVLGSLVGIGYGVAWRILDARWFGVPQRRRRVFVVGCVGDPRCAAQVLAVCESCGGHPAARRAEGPRPAFSLTARAASGSRLGPAWSTNYVATLDANYGHLQGASGQDLRHGHSHLLARALTSHPDRQDGTVDTYVTTLRAEYGEQCFRGDGADPVVAFDWMASGSERTRTVSPGDYAWSNGTRNRTAISGSMGVRRLTPLECERLMGWPDEWTHFTADGREIVDGHRYRMCGNGVVAPVAEWLGHRLMAAHAFDADRSH